MLSQRRDLVGVLGVIGKVVHFQRIVHNVVKLDPIVSNLGTQGSDWIRIEIGLIVRQGESLSSETDKMDVTEQVITLLRRSTIDDLSGPTAFLQFREDLNDTVRLTTEGRAEAVRILSLVIE